MLVANITLYFSLAGRSPFSQTPLVYDPRKNSSAISRPSTPSQYGNWPSVLRTVGSEVIPPPTVM